jgi:hypothetical protein
MPVREVIDQHGRHWTIWRVSPEYVERRQSAHPEIVRQVGERRKRKEARATVSAEYRNGWLAFETAGERRRLVPVPEGWAEWTDEQLLDLIERALLLPPRRRVP